jgi:hypothetical protein
MEGQVHHGQMSHRSPISLGLQNTQGQNHAVCKHVSIWEEDHKIQARLVRLTVH